MEEVKFFATIGEDKIIRLPSGISIPDGEVEVTVRAAATGPSSEEEDIASLRALLLGLAAEVEALGISLPSDMAENHDYYAHGKPLP